MKVFISSVIGGMEEYRDAADQAITTLQHTTVRAENFPASSTSPRLACLQGVQISDAMLLLIGGRYGDKQRSGLSATHEEYVEARKIGIPVFVMVQKDVNRDSLQQNFLNEIREWEDGHYTASFESPNDLLMNAIKALHNLDIQQAQGPVDADKIINRSLEELSEEKDLMLYQSTQQRAWPQNQRRYYQRMPPQSPAIALSLSCGPTTNILRPAQIESSDLKNSLRGMALLDQSPLFSIDYGAQIHIEAGKMNIVQEGRFVRIDEYGTLVYVAVLPKPDLLSAIIEEDVEEEIGRFIEFSRRALDHIDDSNRLSHCGIASTLLNATYSDWKTRAEYQRKPTTSGMPLAMSPQRMQPITLSPPTVRRHELASRKEEMTKDLVIKMRRIYYP